MIRVVVIALILVWTGSFTPKVQWTLTLVILGFWLGVASELRQRVVFPLQTLSNLLAALREGDPIIFDIPKRRLDVDLPDSEMRTRLAQWKAPPPRYATGVFAKYAALVSSASEGAVTRPR